MKVFVKTDGTILSKGTFEAEFGGPWGQMQNADPPLAKWLDVPEGEVLEDCDVSFSGVTVNAVRKAARVAKETAKAARKARLQAADAIAGGLPELKAIVQDLLDERKD